MLTVYAAKNRDGVMRFASVYKSMFSYSIVCKECEEIYELILEPAVKSDYDFVGFYDYQKNTSSLLFSSITFSSLLFSSITLLDTCFEKDTQAEVKKNRGEILYYKIVDQKYIGSPADIGKEVVF